ncbi:4-alpha-glucanotransferase [Shewanella sp. YIC-542]|uniref:4-alpha-glucanotransferase n=1 Tax=Shewanella mytili TaxID=3377111 RepID=UPI00398E9960
MDLEKLLYLQGVGNGFVDCDGQHHTTPAADRLSILQAMCHGELAPLDDTAFAVWSEQRIDLLDARPWRTLLLPFQWCYTDTPKLRFRCPQTFDGELQLQLVTESGSSIALRFFVSDLPVTGDYYTHEQLYLERELALSDRLSADQLSALVPGYHSVSLSVTGADAALGDLPATAQGMWLLAPRRSYGAGLPGQLPHKPWGVSVQLFALWSETDCAAHRSGIPATVGDFADLAAFIRLMAAKGADFIQLNPLHALPLHHPEAASPYSPYDRRRLHPLYISVALCPESSEPQWQAALPKKQPANDNGSEWIDYPAAFKVKVGQLKALFNVFKGYAPQHPRQQAYARFVSEQGAALQFYAHLQAQDAVSPWLKNPAFYLYLQFVAEEQLAQCQALTQTCGMSIGLVRDLAVGAIGEGAEVQQHPQQFCARASIGAPPDPFAPQGQNWGLTPLDPVGLRQANFGHFIELLRANMQHCGALRIDHMMGLFRLWWWPQGADDSAPGGTYVYYPFDCLMAILLLESQRAGCMVIGEDLGLVPTEIIEPMQQGGIFSNELFYFCLDETRYPQFAGFKAPGEYKPHALMMLANHDVPTMHAWWQGKDLQQRYQLGLYQPDELQQALALRQQKKHGLLRWLYEYSGQSLPVTADFATLLPLWAATVASGNSELYSLALADLLAEETAINIPGTSTEYPNWRRRYSHSLQQLAQHPLLRQTLHGVQHMRRHNIHQLTGENRQ